MTIVILGSSSRSSYSGQVMQIEFDFSNEISLRALMIAIVIFIILALGGLGYAVTPVDVDGLVMLTPERWQAAALARQAMAEAEIVQQDLASLNRLLSAENPDPVTAMLLAQRIYANNKTGTSATAAVRTTLIEASEVAARYATGAAERNAAVSAQDKVVVHLGKLLPAEGNEEGKR